MAQEVAVRPARMGDPTWAMQAQAEVYRDEFGYAPEFEHYLVRGLARYFEGFDARLDRFWVAEATDAVPGDAAASAPVGCIAIQHASDRPGWAQLRWYLVLPAHRGAGVGRRLMDEALAFARAAGYEGILLWTVDDLGDAARVYERAGFRPVHTADEPCSWAPWGREQRWELALA